ncbi:unnamed protein product [Amoebophrya sp. A120]|nr:unnamed protein product [Amoebophrya sp. A120]|eukprot:GSA120T00003384001.1
MDAASICSLGSSYLTNCVEALFGHAASRDIANDLQLCRETMERGQKFLTHDSHGSQSKGKPYRWICYRWIPPTELLAAYTRCERRNAKGFGKKGKGRGGGKHKNQFAEVQMNNRGSVKMSELHHDTRGEEHDTRSDGLVDKASELKDGVWHRVIHDISDRRVVTSHFATNMDVVQTVIGEKFDLLEDGDDPGVLQAALQDPFFVEMLKMYFQTGDQQNPRFFHTLAQMQLRCFGGQTLLHFCCEQGFLECVRFLVEKHAARTTNHEEPWLQWADPMFQEKSWGNTAFSIACYRADAKMLTVLLDSWWLRFNTPERKQEVDEIAFTVRCARRVDKNYSSLLERVVDKKDSTLLQMVEERVKKIGRGGAAERQKYLNCYNVLQPHCPRTWKPLETNGAAAPAWVDDPNKSACTSTSARVERSAQPFAVLDTKERDEQHRLAAALSRRDLTLAELQSEIRTAFADFAKPHHTDLLISNITLQPFPRDDSGESARTSGNTETAEAAATAGGGSLNDPLELSAKNFFAFVRLHGYRTVVFKDCDAPSMNLAVSLVSGVATALRSHLCDPIALQVFEFPFFYLDATDSLDGGVEKTSPRLLLRPALLELRNAIVDTFHSVNFYRTNVNRNWDCLRREPGRFAADEPGRSSSAEGSMLQKFASNDKVAGDTSEHLFGSIQSPAHEISRATSLKQTIFAELGSETSDVVRKQRNRLQTGKEMNFFL